MWKMQLTFSCQTPFCFEYNITNTGEHWNKMCTGWYSAISQAYNKDHVFLMVQRHTDRKLNIGELLNKLGNRDFQMFAASKQIVVCVWGRCRQHVLMLRPPTAAVRTVGRPAGYCCTKWWVQLVALITQSAAMSLFILCRIRLCLIITTSSRYNLSSVTDWLCAFVPNIPAWHLLSCFD